MGFLSPLIFISAQTAPTSPSSTFWPVLGNLLGILLVQGVALYIFYKKMTADRLKEEGDREALRAQFEQARQAEIDRDAKTLRMNMKRDVYMEVAPAIQQSSALLAEYLRFDEPVQKIQNGIRVSQKKIQQSIAKVVPVASDDTLDAMRAIQSAFVASGIRLAKARIAFDSSRNEPTGPRTQVAIHVLFDAWTREVAVLPPLMADLANSIRKDLEMPFDRGGLKKA